jgi:signal transduction histidine kinase
LFLIFPAVTIAAGVSVLIIETVDYKRELAEIETLFKAHVDSLAALIREGTREASASTSLFYEVTEDHLASSAHLIASSRDQVETDTDHLKSEHGISLLITADEQGVFSGYWGKIPENKRGAFIDWMRKNEEYKLVDDGPNDTLGLACLRYQEDERGMGIVCMDAAGLSALRRETGIGPLFKNVVQKDVVYVALQDSEGVLAASPPNVRLSSWQEDSLLKTALNQGTRHSTTRLAKRNDRSIFEGLVPFQMADESFVLLRVGIDAAVLSSVREQTTRRFMRTLLLVSAVSLMTVFLAGLLWVRSNRVEAAEKRLTREQEEKKHWETIGQMAATVAHEVRNPLNTIGMAAQRLMREFSIVDAERAEFYEMTGLLTSESERVGRVVTGFLELGKPLILDRRVVPIQEAINDAVLPSQMRAEKENKHLKTVFHFAGDILIDKPRFRQMLSNLIDNALDAVGVQGHVWVEASTINNDTVIAIRDDGLGMNDKELLEVMKPFFSYKKSGTGLGLPLVKRIAEAHGGGLRIISEPKQGTTVEIRIPLSTSRS